MSHRHSPGSLSLAIMVYGLSTVASADPQLPIPAVPPAPPGYLLVDEEMWSQLMDETGRHFDRARDAFLHGHTRTTAIELRKAAIMMRIEAANGRERADLAVLKSAHDLERLAHALLDGRSTDTIDDVDLASSQALSALAHHDQVKAEAAWKMKRAHRSGHYLRVAADNLERASFRARFELTSATSSAIRNARNLSRKLIDGTDYALDEVGVGIDAVGHQIERFQQSIVSLGTDRR